MRIFWLSVLIIVALALVRASLFTVGPTEFVYVTEFGRHIATYDGGDYETDAGLHLRWPWPIQSLQRLDRRLQLFDLPGTELLTHDSEGKTIDKTLTVEAYACWRIPTREAVDVFIRRLGTPDRARAVLGQRINSQLGAAIGRMTLDDLVSIEPGRVEKKMAELWRGLTGGLRPELRDEYGIELVDVRLRRFNHPPEVRESIFERIRSERNKKAEFYRTEGDRQASRIRTEAQVKAQELRAQARAEAEQIRGQADTEAAAIRNGAQTVDADFYGFLKKLEQLSSILGDTRTILLLSTQRKAFDILDPPQPSSSASTPMLKNSTDKSKGGN